MRLSVAMAVMITVLAGGGAMAEQTPAKEVTMEQVMARMKEAAQLGPHHKALGRYLGNWDVEIALLMPGSPAQRSTGTAVYSWAIDGRWITQRITGQFMGSPYEGFALVGFDNYAKNHVAVAVSSMDTAMIMTRGLVGDPTHKVRTLYGTLDEYTTGELHKPLKVVLRDETDARHVMEIWDLGIGEAGAKVLEYTFTRKK
ncbi:MAG: DUF1579 family protein [Acidobacteria bacterium]|nr:DUF1579 family protein [Acidobacteriota bacterium]